MSSPSRTRLPSSTRSSASRPWILADTTALRRATRYPEAARIGVPADTPPPPVRVALAVSTVTARKASRARNAYSPPNTSSTGISSSSGQRHGLFAVWSRSMRSEASSPFRSLNVISSEPPILSPPARDRKAIGGAGGAHDTRHAQDSNGDTRDLDHMFRAPASPPAKQR